MKPSPVVVVALAALLLPTGSQAGKAMDVCRDANGKPYFTDRGCPEDTVQHGRDYVPDAQSATGLGNVDPRTLERPEQQPAQGENWDWRQAPGSGQ